MIMKNAFPQPDMRRSEWLNLNGEWDFSLDSPVYDKKINVPYPWGSPLSGIEDDKDGTGYYRRVVRWSPKGGHVFLIFGAVDYDCVVRVNGKELGSHRGGYARFEFDVTDVWDRSGDNTIEVEATDISARSQTYGKQGYGNARGIWQTVWLEARPEAWIDSFFIKTSLDGEITISAELAGKCDGCVVDSDFGGVTASAEVKDGSAELVFRIDEPALWSPEEPNLYEGIIALRVGDTADVVSTYFGIREIGTGVFGEHGHRYITLNGKPYFINGVLDQSFNPKGFFTLPSDDDCREEILRLKRIGINMARIHIKAEEPLKLYYADKLGLLIMEDIPCFWGEPTPEARVQFEREMEWQIKRDRSHPSIFYWVVFNETWGLISNLKNEDGTEKREYTAETAEWVVDCFHKAKALDPTRLIEDNSVCNQDHTVTDVNTWHFYSNGYENVKNVVHSFCEGAHVGSEKNYKSGYTMADVPCMNSECGNVWGVDGNAGDSDISWQYRYMINEFRLHDKLCGFVFTEFHDVVNEFNGYYKIDNSDKDFGYDEYGTGLRDLHSQDYLGADFAPMTTVRPGDLISVPMFGSSFTDLRHGKALDISWQLRLCDPVDGDSIADAGEYSIIWKGYGEFDAGVIRTVMPDHDGVAVLMWTLFDGSEAVMSNAVLFDVDGEREDVYTAEPSALTGSGFGRIIPAIQGAKVSGLGSGEFTLDVNTDEIPGFDGADDIELIFEASTRTMMSHDYPDKFAANRIDLNYMLGYRCDPGANRNSFQQTDENKAPGKLAISCDGEKFAEIVLPDCPADSRGSLSHHYQPAVRQLDEAGSYGTLVSVKIPSRILLKIADKPSFTLTFRMEDDAGLSVFGRRSGRYGIGIILKAE